jgi:signal transduction histidine kinase
LIRELVALTRYQVPPEIELRIQAPEHLLCWLPESPLRQSLLNLVLNSAQALGNNGGAIVIDAHRSGGRIELSVTDTGPGFSEETLAAGVRPFVTGRSGGTGLGLAIVQRFVRDVGGKLSLSNAEPHGACVRLTIPLHFA